MQVHRPLNQVASSLVDQEVSHQIENHSLNPDDLHRTYPVDEFEVRILEPEKSGGPWLTKATIPMQNSENALTVRVVTLLVSLNLVNRAFFYSSNFFSPAAIFFQRKVGLWKWHLGDACKRKTLLSI